jgi:hypothetical protein
LHCSQCSVAGFASVTVEIEEIFRPLSRWSGSLGFSDYCVLSCSTVIYQHQIRWAATLRDNKFDPLTFGHGSWDQQKNRHDGLSVPKKPFW